MDHARAAEFAAALRACGEVPGASPNSPIGGRQEALDAAATLARDGKLFRAQLAYRDIIAAGGGAAAYLGLARTIVALDDAHGALQSLRDGAVRLTRASDRAGAIELLSEAVQIAPLDHPAHRRLAAAHANAGDVGAARAEYVRFVARALEQGDAGRAQLEIAYARETLGEHPSLLALEVSVRSRNENEVRVDEANDPGLVDARRQAVSLGSDRPARATTVAPAPTPVEAVGTAQRPLGGAPTSAARALVAERKLYAASDMLLEYIGRGGNDREAQLLLIETASALGRPDAARDKARLLAAAYRLDGTEQLAVAVESLALNA